MCTHTQTSMCTYTSINESSELQNFQHVRPHPLQLQATGKERNNQEEMVSQLKFNDTRIKKAACEYYQLISFAPATRLSWD